MKKIFLITFLINVFFTKAQIITTVAGNGVQGYSGDNGQAISAQLYYPTDVSIDHSGNIYIADQLNNRIRKVDLMGNITTAVGTGTQGYFGDEGVATASELYNPTNIVFDPSGNLCFSDRNNNVVRRINTSGIISTIAGDGISGFSGDGGQATQCKFTLETGLAIDNFSNIYVADEDNHRIRKLDANGVIITIAGNGTQGFSGDGAAATLAELYRPRYVNFDANGNLYIADQYNHRIRKVDAAGIITTIAGTGVAGYSGDGGQATNAQLYYPRGITIDAAGNVYIADTYNNVIRRVNTSGIISTVAGIGVSGYSGDGGVATNAKFNTPIGMAIDASGNLYVADGGNNRIRKIANVAQMSIDQLKNQNIEIKLYPNPTSSLLQISITGNQNIKYNAQITDVLGNEISKQTININNQTTIDVSNLSNGVYFIRVGNSTQKFIVQH